MKIAPAPERAERARLALFNHLRDETPLTWTQRREVWALVSVYARACEDVARGEETRRLLRNHQVPAPEAPQR